MGLKDAALAVAFLLCLVAAANGFYLPGSYPVVREPGTGEKSELWAKVNSLTSIETELPYSYYSLPFCKPDRIGKDSENLGELLMGDRIENSPYKFLMQQTQTAVKLCVSDALREDEVKTLKQRIDDYYQVNLILDNLPAIRYTRAPDSQESFQWTGFPIGYYVPTKDSKDSKVYYINNHLQFKIKYHEYENSGKENIMSTGEGFDAVGAMEPNKTGAMVVGFEVQACSIKRDPAEADPLPKYSSLPAIECSSNGAHQEVKAHERIVFTYDVQWEKSDIRWPSRWDAYLKMEGAKVHWFSILNSLMVISFLAGIVFVIFLRTVRRDLTKYEELDKEAQAQMNEELSGWKLVVGDVFRPPTNSGLLCIMVGDGVQITGMAVVTILFAALGFMSPASRGMLLTGMVFLYLFLGVVAGYTAARLWKTLKGGDATGWRSISWRVASFFPGITFTILTLLNFLLWSKHSTGAIPLYLFFLLFAMWFGISVPLTLLGGFIGSKAEAVSFPVRTNQIPREVPPQKYPSWLLVLGAGTLPFGTLFIELFFILSSMWLNRVYYVFGFLFVVLVLLVIVCAEVSVVLTYMHLCVEDWRWWWKSFFASGSVALYVFLYSLNYFVFDLHSLKGPVSAVLYVGYSVLMVLAIMLATGTVGFLASFYFVHYLFSSVKLD